MASRDDIERIAAAVNAVRSDWQVRSLVTYLTQHHGARPFRVLLVAALVVATDERTQTPKLLEQQGPWWAAGQAAVGGFADVRFERCDKPGHSSYPKRNCGACRSEDIGLTDDALAAREAAMREDMTRRAEASRRARMEAGA